ncbi:MAG: hypothetical protein IK076_05335 [Bacteroidales bacterium]|nr:hypothetical protein [Bacteroidales bacterium]
MNRFLSVFLLLIPILSSAQDFKVKSFISIKQPGDPSVRYEIDKAGPGDLPVTVTESCRPSGQDEVAFSVTIRAKERTFYNYQAEIDTGFPSGETEYYLPGFWYHLNLRSPERAPSFHSSKAWNFREDRMSAPMAAAYDKADGRAVSVLRRLDEGHDALTASLQGEVILSGESSIGYLGIDSERPSAFLTFGYPYIETPTSYIHKLTLAPPVHAFAKLEAGEEKTLTWYIHTGSGEDYSDFVSKAWEYSFDRIAPEPLVPLYSPEQMKAQLSKYFKVALVDGYPLKFYSSLGMRVDRCINIPIMEIGFCGRALLNAFNAVEYGEQTGQDEIFRIGTAIFDSFLENGFTSNGYLLDYVDFRNGIPPEETMPLSIRRESEGIYAIMLYLKYEKEHGRIHKEWEKRMRTILDNLVGLLKEDGHYARKFYPSGEDVDPSSGSTPSATSALVMGYKYFGDKKYLAAAKRTIDFIEENIISKSDYYSSTLDNNCEDKEAAIAAVTATYYLAMVTKGKERQHYLELCRKATYFALSWYYLWDIPYSQGLLFGDLGLKTRGWGNVSVENNCADVFIFELAHIAKWLGETMGEPRFVKMYDLIVSSLDQLLPMPGRMCGMAKEGYHPEYIQSTAWEYGENGRGFYSIHFAPGWAIASLWELYSPTRTSHFLE